MPFSYLHVSKLTHLKCGASRACGASMIVERKAVGLKKGKGSSFNETLKLGYLTCWWYRTGTGDTGQSRIQGAALSVEWPWGMAITGDISQVLLVTHHRPDASLRVRFCLALIATSELKNILIRIEQRLEKVRTFPDGHTVSKWERRDSPRPPDPRVQPRERPQEEPCVCWQSERALLSEWAVSHPGTGVIYSTWSPNCFRKRMVPVTCRVWVCWTRTWVWAQNRTAWNNTTAHMVSLLLWTGSTTCSASRRSTCWTNGLKAHQILILP